MSIPMVEYDLFTDFTSGLVGRDDNPSAFNGPYYPKVTAGLLTLDTVDQGERFLVSGGTWIIDDGASGAHLAYIRKVSLGPSFTGGFVLFPE